VVLIGDKALSLGNNKSETNDAARYTSVFADLFRCVIIIRLIGRLRSSHKA
jgi:hypothetical protein